MTGEEETAEEGHLDGEKEEDQAQNIEEDQAPRITDLEVTDQEDQVQAEKF